MTFVAGYVPFLGAWTAGIFAVALALASQGTTDALIMALIVFLANGPLQQIVQPIAVGAALELNALVVFVVTIAAGSLFGMVGLILAAPLISGRGARPARSGRDACRGRPGRRTAGSGRGAEPPAHLAARRRGASRRGDPMPAAATGPGARPAVP